MPRPVDDNRLVWIDLEMTGLEPDRHVIVEIACIVTDNDLDSMGEQADFVHQGQTIKVCCKPCIAKFEKNPAKYLKKLEGK